jgi:hypothetical protein
MYMKYRVNNIDRTNFKALDSSLRKIIISKLSHFNDIHDYLDDLVSNAFIVLSASAKRYNSSKSSFSTYCYSRVVSSSKKLYYSLKYPYSGIIALMGKTKKEQDAFLTSVLSNLSSIDELDIEIPDKTEIMEIEYA